MAANEGAAWFKRASFKHKFLYDRTLDVGSHHDALLLIERPWFSGDIGLLREVTLRELDIGVLVQLLVKLRGATIQTLVMVVRAEIHQTVADAIEALDVHCLDWRLYWSLDFVKMCNKLPKVVSLAGYARCIDTNFAALATVVELTLNFPSDHLYPTTYANIFEAARSLERLTLTGDVGLLALITCRSVVRRLTHLSLILPISMHWDRPHFDMLLMVERFAEKLTHLSIRVERIIDVYLQELAIAATWFPALTCLKLVFTTVVRANFGRTMRQYKKHRISSFTLVVANAKDLNDQIAVDIGNILHTDALRENVVMVPDYAASRLLRHEIAKNLRVLEVNSRDKRDVNPTCVFHAVSICAVLENLKLYCDFAGLDHMPEINAPISNLTLFNESTSRGDNGVLLFLMALTRPLMLHTLHIGHFHLSTERNARLREFLARAPGITSFRIDLGMETMHTIDADDCAFVNLLPCVGALSIGCSYPRTLLFRNVLNLKCLVDFECLSTGLPTPTDLIEIGRIARETIVERFRFSTQELEREFHEIQRSLFRNRRNNYLKYTSLVEQLIQGPSRPPLRRIE